MPPGWCRQGRAAGQDQGPWSGGMTCVGMSKRMLYAYAILLLSLLRRCWTCYAEDALSTINNMAGNGGGTAGRTGATWEAWAWHGIGSGAERRSIIARMMTHDGKTYVGMHFIYCANGDGAMAPWRGGPTGSILRSSYQHAAPSRNISIGIDTIVGLA